MSDFLVHLYTQLAVDAPMTEKTNVRQKSFDDLSLLVAEHSSKLVNNLRWMKEKVSVGVIDSRHSRWYCCNGRSPRVGIAVICNQ